MNEKSVSDLDDDKLAAERLEKMRQTQLRHKELEERARQFHEEMLARSQQREIERAARLAKNGKTAKSAAPVNVSSAEMEALEMSAADAAGFGKEGEPIGHPAWAEDSASVQIVPESSSSSSSSTSPNVQPLVSDFDFFVMSDGEVAPEVDPAVLYEAWNEDLGLSLEHAHKLTRVFRSFCEVRPFIFTLDEAKEGPGWSGGFRPARRLDYGQEHNSDIWDVFHAGYQASFLYETSPSGEQQLKQGVLAVLNLRDVPKESFEQPKIQIRGLPQWLNVIELLRSGDLVQFHIDNPPREGEPFTEEQLREMLADGSIYRATLDRCEQLQTEAMRVAAEVGTFTGNRVFAGMVGSGNKNLARLWERKYGRAPTKTELARASVLGSKLLTDDEYALLEKAMDQARQDTGVSGFFKKAFNRKDS